MVEPTSTLEEDVDPDDAPDCNHCGAPVVGERHRVVSDVEDGTARHRHFCDDECLAAWRSTTRD